MSISASPALLESSGSWVKVVYSGVKDPKKDDLVAVYSPTPDTPEVDLLKYSPIKYVVCSLYVM